MHKIATIEVTNNCKKRFSIKSKTAIFLRRTNIPPENKKNKSTLDVCMTKQKIKINPKNIVLAKSFDLKKSKAVKKAMDVYKSGIN